MIQTTQNEDRAGNEVPQFVIAILAILAAFSIGTYLAWPSLALPLYSENDALRLNDVEGSWISSLIPLSAALAVLPAATVAEKVGRKVTLWLITLPFCVCCFVLDFAAHKFWIYLACVGVGAACGAASTVVPMYVTEIADLKVRKSLGRIFHVLLVLGIFIGDFVGIRGNLHSMSMLCAAVPAFLLLTIPFVPESPVWLITRERRKDAECVLRCLRGRTSSSPEQQPNEFQLARGFYGLKSGIGDLVYYKRATIVVIGLAIFQQFCGVGALTFFAPEIFDRAKSNLDSTTGILILGAAQVIAACFSTTLMTRVGQKLLLFLSLSAIAVSMFVLAGYFHFQNISDVSNVNWLPAVCLTLFVIAFNVGLGPVPWKMADTFFISHMKRAATSAMILCNWCLAFLVTKSFRNLMDLAGASTLFAIFGLFGLFGTAFVAYMVPETEGKSIKEIQSQLYGERDSGFERSVNRI